MPFFRKKPVVIEARQFSGTNPEEILAWGDEHGIDVQAAGLTMDDEGQMIAAHHLFVGTLEGDMRADIGDFIIRGVKGEFYPCKPDIFAQTYEPAAARPSHLPSREEVERAARVYGATCRRIRATDAELDAALRALLSLIPYRSDR